MDQPPPLSTASQLIADTVVPATTITPVPEVTTQPPPPPPKSAAQQPPGSVEIKMAASSDGQDEALVARLTGIVNRVYFDTESDIFVEGFQRTDAQEVRSIIEAGELAVAYLVPTSPPTSPPDQQETQEERKAIGCIRIRQVAADVGELGMMALDPAHQGGGTGSALVRFAEGHIQETLKLPISRLELLVPSSFHHAFKARLQAWYDRMGYRVVRLGVFQDEYPKIAALLRGPTEYRVFEKALGA
ncbi:Ribosomal protein S18 acetylase RimI [Apiospora marii]|uniref:Ribosomal protein S18 acetylase RimI n=1 Tax=Apiospora marii TaxID=335849 RepID=A0ABR1SDA1_9PEZI